MSEPTDAFDFQNFYSATLTSDITAGTLTIALDSAPTPTEGVLVIDPDSTSPEVIYYTSKGASSVTCPADGRGWDDTTATAHGQGTPVIMAPTAYAWRMLKNGSLFDSYRTGWTTLGDTPDTVTANGNRSYDLVFAGNDLTDTVSPGMRLKLTRTVTAPTYMGGAFNGSSHYFTKTTPSGTLGTVTNNFTLMAWVEPTSYADGTICGRSDATPANGLGLRMLNTGQVYVQVWSGGGSNFRYVLTYQSLPLNKKTHVAASWTGGTVVIYFDGVSVPVQTAVTSGTAPTTAATGGDWSIGRLGAYAASYFPGYISGVAAFDAVLSASTIKSYMSQKPAGNETNCIGAWALNNNGTDDSSAGNNVTATGGVGYTSRSPYGTGADGTSAGTTEYAIITKASFSTNTTLTVQVPEGSAIPTSGGVSAVSYSAQKVPYGFPAQGEKWRILGLHMTADATTSNATYGAFQSGGWQLVVPAGAWKVGYSMPGAYNVTTTTIYFGFSPSALTGLTHAQGAAVYNSIVTRILSPSAAAVATTLSNSIEDAFSTTQTFIMYTLGSTTSAGADGSTSTNVTFAECAYL